MAEAEAAKICAAKATAEAEAEVAAVRAEIEVVRAQAQAEAVATVKAMVACISELEVGIASSVYSASVGTQCGRVQQKCVSARRCRCLTMHCSACGLRRSGQSSM